MCIIITADFLSSIIGGRLLLEMNRILRPGGYFLLSAKHHSIEEEEGLPLFYKGSSVVVSFYKDGF